MPDHVMPHHVPPLSPEEFAQRFADLHPALRACAAELRNHGIAVTIFDRNPLAGGLNTYGIAEYKLRPVDSQKEVELVRSMGVDLRLGVDVSERLDKVEQDFDAIFLGVGLGVPHRMNVPGEELPGVF